MDQEFWRCTVGVACLWSLMLALSWEDWTAGSHSAGWELGTPGGFLTLAWCLSWHQLWLLNTHLLVACPRDLSLLTSSQPQTFYTGHKYRVKCSEDKAPTCGLLWPSLKVTWHHFCRILLIKAATGSIREMRWHGTSPPDPPFLNGRSVTTFVAIF